MAQRRKSNFRKKEEPAKHRINDKIRVSHVRLIGDNVKVEVYTTTEAIKIADELELDLVEISPNAEPPVCRIIDYKKFLYNEKKSKKDHDKKQRENRIETKELRFGPNTEDHDFQFKVKHAIKFLKEGNRVKAMVQFRGRQIVFKEQGEILLLRF